MRRLQAPAEAPALFDLEPTAWWSTQLAPGALRHLRAGWQGLFQSVILRLLEKPAEALGAHFDQLLGRPTKELYALSGLLLIAEFKDWTIDQAAEAWSLDAGVQFALHLPRDRQYLCPRTLDNYRRLLREDGDVAGLFSTITARLVEELELDIRRQRLDSTHVLSQMARLGRLQLLAVGVRRFLVALHKADPPAYGALPVELRERYQPAETRLFGLGTRSPQPREEALAQVAQDLAALVDRFAENPAHHRRASYQALVRLLREHCAVRPERPAVTVRSQSQDEHGGSARCLQNPSDPEAGYSGHKGAGYQVQLAQALPPRDAQGRIEGPGLLTACVPQSAAESDRQALGAVLAQQQGAGLLPECTLADGAYGSDANVNHCATLGIELISPVTGRPQRAGGEAEGVAGAPCHHATRAERALKERLALRRQAQQSEAWQEQYRARSGIEGVHRALDVVTGIKRLRVRGLRAVSVAVTLKAAGWNILAAAKIKARRARRQRREGLAGAAVCQNVPCGARRAPRTSFRRAARAPRCWKDERRSRSCAPHARDLALPA